MVQERHVPDVSSAGRASCAAYERFEELDAFSFAQDFPPLREDAPCAPSGNILLIAGLDGW
jgi:hypothetical protein